MTQEEIDKKNAEFWNDLCGTWLARSLGITEISPESLHRIDEAYFAFYPYLKKYMSHEALRGKKVLEIGLGYGTLGHYIASGACNYYGLDIAEGPVVMMKYRLAQLGQNNETRVTRGSAHSQPYYEETFDFVYTIGVLHQTGNIVNAISEVHRVLKVGGKAIVMVYNRHSFRQLIYVPLLRLKTLLEGREMIFKERVRSLYDTNTKGKAAPHTDYISWFKCKQLFKDFKKVKIDIRNFSDLSLRGKVLIPRDKLLNNIGRILGLDLYITAIK